MLITHCHHYQLLKAVTSLTIRLLHDTRHIPVINHLHRHTGTATNIIRKEIRQVFSLQYCISAKYSCRF